MVDFKPRDYQRSIIDFIGNRDRCNIWAGMGTGKSVSALTALDLLTLADDPFPALVLAPLRVAASTWPGEVSKWKHLHGMDLQSWAGTRQFPRTVPDVATVNYDNVAALVDHFGDRWPFKTVIADESTRLKSYRARQGGVRAQALGKVAHKHVRRWVNLTGTPAPNGLRDLWGQAWFIDAGQRLGRTFSAFENRWFRSVQVGNSRFATQLVPFDHSQAEIEGRLADCTITVRAADFMDLPPLIENTIAVDLPPAARRHYRDLEREMFTILASGDEVEAVSAAAKTIKCIAKGTPVLTDAGWVPIESVTPDHLLWDGDNWVSSFGAVLQGYKPVVQCFGVWMTPDHKVLTESGWREAQEVINAKPPERPDRQSVRLPDRYRQGGFDNMDKETPGHLATSVRLRGAGDPGKERADESQSRRVEVVRVPPARDDLSRNRHSWDDGSPGVGYLEQHAIALPQPERQRLAELRCAWDRRVRQMGGVFRKLLGRHGGELDARDDTGPGGQQRQLREGQLPMGDRLGAVKQPQGERRNSDAKRANDSGPGIAGVWRESDHHSQADRARVARGSTAAVYDIINAGPQARFVVKDNEGCALIVHNCLQAANGALYVGEGSADWKELHDAKIEALKSVVEEAAGVPILVAYHFRSDLARLQLAFPQGRALDADPRTLEAWNRGDIPVLFAHPASAGHGLSLQDGGNIIVFFGLWWDLEAHEQIIERIGPTRQAQSGYNRPVFVHRIVARSTVDELVLARLQTKASVQSLLLDAMKGQR